MGHRYPLESNAVADPADIAHLLRRTEFVARPARVSALSALTIEQAVADIIDFTANANPQVPSNLAIHDSSNSYTQRVNAYHWWFD